MENMDYVFSHAYSFNGDLSNWDVSSATSMYGMFAHSQDFEGDGLETWNTGNVKDMQARVLGGAKVQRQNFQLEHDFGDDHEVDV